MAASIKDKKKIIHILKHLKLKNLFLIYKSILTFLFPSLNTYNNGCSSSWYQKGIICCKPSIFKSCGYPKGLPCSLCQRENVLKLLQISKIFLNIICMKTIEYPITIVCMNMVEQSRTIMCMNMVKQSRTISVCIRQKNLELS